MPRKHFLILCLIIAIAIFFRFWQLDSIPPGLYQDEAMNGSDALTSLKNGKFSAFYTNNNGREGMIVWLDALAVKLFGNEPWVLRLFPAVAGVLAVLGLYFLTKKLFSVKVALASSFFMSISFWAVNFSRIGFRAGLMLPFLIWSFYFLYRGVNKNQNSDAKKSKDRIFDFIFAGILFGLGFYTYISYRFAPVFILMYFFPLLIKSGNKKLWAGFFMFTATAFIIALPIGLYFFNNPGDFFGRSSQVSIFASENILKAAGISAAAAAGMFNVLGDLNWRHNLSGAPQLLPPIGLLFILGIILGAKHFNKPNKFLFFWLFIFLLPNVLSTEGNPHALRALGSMPPAMIFSGIGLIWICEKLKKFIDDKIKNPEFTAHFRRLVRIKKEMTLLLFVFLFTLFAVEFNRYFLRWPENPDTAGAFSKNQVVIADYLNNLPFDKNNKYAIWHPSDRPTSNGLPVFAQTVYFLTYGKSKINFIKADEFEKIKLDAGNAVIIPLYFDLNLIHNLNKKFPKSKIEFIDLNIPILIVSPVL